MRTPGKAAIAAVAVFSIGLTGCSDNSASPGTASSGAASGNATAGASGSAGAGGGSTTGATGGGQGTAASCLAGTWKADNLTGKLSGPVNGTFTGGGGTLLT